MPFLKALAVLAVAAQLGGCSAAAPEAKPASFPLGKTITPTMDPWERTGADLGNKQVTPAAPPVVAPAVTAPAPAPKAQ